MLVLTRKVGEQIVVPQCNLTVSVVGIVGKRVRLGISAPQDVVVHRQEVQQRIAAESSPTSQDVLRSTHVLIADHDRLLLAAYSQHLTLRGANVSTARTGLECWEKLRQSVPNLLVLEPELLWGGGDGVLALLNEQPSIRPDVVMLLTHNRNRSLLYRSSSFKVDDFLTKPLTATQLTERICSLLLPLDRGSVVRPDTQSQKHGNESQLD